MDEAIRLMRESKRSLYEEADPAHSAHDPTSAIFELAKQLALAGAAGGGPDSSGVVLLAELEARAVMKGFVKAQLDECIRQVGPAPAPRSARPCPSARPPDPSLPTICSTPNHRLHPQTPARASPILPTWALLASLGFRTPPHHACQSLHPLPCFSPSQVRSPPSHSRPAAPPSAA